MTVNKSRSSSQRTRAPETTTTEAVTEEDTEVETEEASEEETTDMVEREDMTIEDPEEILAIGQRAASTAARRVTWQETAQNVY